MKKELGIIGLGKMGGNITRRLIEHGWHVVGFDIAHDTVKALSNENMTPAYTLDELVAKVATPRVIWMMVPAGKSGDELLFGKNGLMKKISNGDVVIDGGNSYFKDTIRRAKKIAGSGVIFIDVGFSGGPGGARSGGCLMIGGKETEAKKLEPLFRDMARENGYKFFNGAGAGHFVKMVHNGIEYGMMQALAEGFALMKKSKFKLDLIRVADIYNHGSVIESRLVGWLKSAFEAYGQDLKEISGTVGYTGEGEWTAKTARQHKVPAKIIEESFKFRVLSQKKPSYTGKLLAGMRNQFGGHSIKKHRMT